jgi:hypothetical protein
VDDKSQGFRFPFDPVLALRFESSGPSRNPPCSNAARATELICLKQGMNIALGLTG